MHKEAFLPPPLSMATGNLVNLEKTSEMSPIKHKFLASYSKQNLIIFEKIEENQQLSIEDPILPVFVNSSQLFF